MEGLRSSAEDPRAEAQGWWGYSAVRRSPGINSCGLVLSVHAALGDQQDRSSQNQDGAADVQDGGVPAAGGVGPKGFPFGCAKPCPWAEAVCEAD